MQKISVILPAYNEELGIAKVLSRLKEVLANAPDSEILVVNDGSTDATASIAMAHGARVISNPTNMGYGFSLKRGFVAAVNECVVITDADGTYPIERLPDLVAEFDKGLDLVVGARQGANYWSSWTKGFARLCFKWMSQFVVGKRIPDINSGFRVIRRSKIVPVLNDLSNAFSFTTSMTLIFFLKHYFIRYLPISYEQRQGRSKVHYFRDTLITLQILADIIARYNPIKLFLLLALFPFALMLVCLVFALVWGVWLWLPLAFLAGFGALLIVALGFIATIFRRN